MSNTELIQKIKKLKEEKNVVILGHYYQSGEIQEISDFVGDSLALSRQAATTDADIILFCGVHFMAETAKLLSPEKKVLLPDLDAGCPMADMVTSESLIDYKNENPDAKIICYVNSTAAVKAQSDVCVTSSNALSIAQKFKGEKLLYVPDQNLGHYLNQQIPELNMDLWPGHCCIHNNLNTSQVEEMQKLHPNAQLIVHPEANPAVVEKADFVGSTKALLEYAVDSEHEEFIVGTERGILFEMNRKCPNKNFYLLSEKLTCRNMKLTNLEKVHHVLKTNDNAVEVEAEMAAAAKHAIDLMLELS